ncbi:capsid assembly protein [Benzoatithermus flavus]|uniref:TipAS antibiotic-recognition domain-containing protein n=1 Tax=Benzoatithermus flavus TaxID=3108223 RepID=A0ABU8XKJ3_9PROT
MTDPVSDAATSGDIPESGTSSPAERPAWIPEKFWDAQQGLVRLEDLARSYLELERKLGSRHPEPDPAPAAEENPPAAAAPQPAAGYRIETRHPLLQQDAELDARLLAAGFSEPQAQLVYDLAAERLLPMIEEALGEIEAQQQLERLQRHFGGPESWRHTARQLKSWGEAHLAPEVYATLAASYEGVLAMHQMMRANEPELLGGGEAPLAEITEDTLVQMMRDPRYWRQRDPEFVARVTAGFKKLYAG